MSCDVSFTSVFKFWWCVQFLWGVTWTIFEGDDALWKVTKNLIQYYGKPQHARKLSAMEKK